MGIIFLFLGAGAVSIPVTITDETVKIADENEYSPLSITITFIEPKRGIYKDMEKIFPFFTVLVIRGLVEVNISITGSPDEIDYVEYWFNNELFDNETNPPFGLAGCLGGDPLTRVTIKVIAYPSSGNPVSKKITIWRLF